MPVVPFTPGPKTKSGRQLPPPPAEPFALMAAAQIHSEGRLLAPEGKPDSQGKDLGGYMDQGLFGSTIGIGDDYTMPRAGKASDYKVKGVDQ